MEAQVQSASALHEQGSDAFVEAITEGTTDEVPIPTCGGTRWCPVSARKAAGAAGVPRRPDAEGRPRGGGERRPAGNACDNHVVSVLTIRDRWVSHWRDSLDPSRGSGRSDGRLRDAAGPAGLSS